jgi:hypothetical protein
MKTKIGVAVAGIGLSFMASFAYAGGEDIYPGAFVEDCSIQFFNGNNQDQLQKNIMEFSGLDVDIIDASKSYRPVCECISEKFFTLKEQGPEAYEIFMRVIGNDMHNSRILLEDKLYVQKIIQSCKTSTVKDANKAAAAKYNKSQGNPSTHSPKASFMASFSVVAPNGANEHYLRKADGIAVCLSKMVDDFSKEHPELRENLVGRINENIRSKDGFVNRHGSNDPQVEAVIMITDRCW